MRPVPVPMLARLLHERGRPLVVADPNGDLTGDEVRPVEALCDTVDLDETVGGRAPCFRLYLRPEGDDLDRLRDGGVIELTLCTTRLPVFQVQVLPTN